MAHNPHGDPDKNKTGTGNYFSQPNLGPLIVRVTAPAGTKDFLRNYPVQTRSVYLAPEEWSARVVERFPCSNSLGPPAHPYFANLVNNGPNIAVLST